MRISKGGRVIPAWLRKERDIRPGDRVRLKAVAGGIELIVYARRRRRSVPPVDHEDHAGQYEGDRLKTATARSGDGGR
jgi:AbrB family looped-hinge helix DNA binding protein